MDAAENLVVGVSGGADSVALLKVLSIMHHGKLKAVIVDHGVQEGSDEVADNAAQIAAELIGDPDAVVVKRALIDAHRNLEANAREARFRLLFEEVGDDDILLLAHTLNDQAESVLLGLGRGSGLSAICGIREDCYMRDEYGAQKRIVRPFLRSIERKDTEEICVSSRIEYWNDPTNGAHDVKCDATFPRRSQIRSELLPVYDKFFPGIVKNLARSATIARDENDFLDTCASEHYIYCVDELGTLDTAKPTLFRSKVATEHPALQRRIIRIWLERCGVKNSRALEYAKIEEIRTRLVNVTGVGGTTIQLDNHCSAVRTGDTITLSARHAG
ncbi:MAG: tRNA lysidine(34) synthetase TilS [Candidatus Ancillula sp.]|nr:tRNA lysidine(34) synthetase TilS [Candidatus Ancillula sp.]